MKLIKLTNTPDMFAIVNDKNYERLNKYQWRAFKGANTWYAVTGHSSSNTRWFMHEMVMGLPPSGYVWDHKDRNGLNNQEENLRLATHSQNRVNSKKRNEGFRGVYPTRRSWERRIKMNGVVHQKGGFATAEEAARDYDTMAIKLHGEFAQLNFPSSSIQ